MAGKVLKSFSCPACGGVVEIHAAGHSISAVCGHCSTLIDTANDNFKIIKKEHEATRHTDLDIGAMGVLDSIKWQVIGYVEKKDKSQLGYWDEYLLFNPYFGFRFLIQADGHWSLATVIKRYFPQAGVANELLINDEVYSVYCHGQSVVEYVKGEFYWRVRKGDEERYTDYIAPPHLLSVEKNKSEVTEIIAEYIAPELVALAFGVELPARGGVAPNQPAPLAGKLGTIWNIAGLAVLAAVFIQLSLGSATLVNNATLPVLQQASEKSYSTPVFHLPRSTNLAVRSVAPLSNNWMELDLSLVNDATNETHQSRQVIEYYSGYEDGESWSEGGRVAESTFSAIPGGDYRLIIDPAAGYSGSGSIDVNMEIKRNVPVWGNFWFIFVAIMLFPLLALLYRWNFENRRWENSDYAPVLHRES